MSVVGDLDMVVESGSGIDDLLDQDPMQAYMSCTLMFRHTSELLSRVMCKD